MAAYTFGMMVAWVSVLLLLSGECHGLAQGGGSSATAGFYKTLVNLYLQETNATSNPTIAYNTLGGGSAKAMCRLLGYSTQCSPTDTQAPTNLDFAVTEVLPLTEAFTAAPDLHIFPLMAVGVSVVYNLPGVDELVLGTSGPQQDLPRMRGCTVYSI